MKIALVSPYDFSHPGGVNNHIIQLEKHFLRMGHQVKILAPRSRRDLTAPNLIPLGRAFPVPSGGSMARITFSLWLAPRVKKVMEMEAFDVAHVHEPLTPFLPALVLMRAHCPKIGTFHACHQEPRGYGLTKPIISSWFERLDGLTAVSIPARDFIARHFPGDYEIVPNGVDLALFRRETPPLEAIKEGKTLLFVGRLEKRKGLDYLLGALARIRKERKDVRLIVVGPGTRRREAYEEMAQEIGGVHFAGFVSSEDLPRYYASAQIFCAPATGEESFGLVLLEAMAMAKPIVATAISGFAQLVTPGREGVLVPPRDEDALAGAILELLEDPARAQAMGERGWQKAQSYSWENIAERTLAVYRRHLVGAPRP
jgi:phosphatidylinositol alpha-mannosyltransferase